MQINNPNKEKNQSQSQSQSKNQNQNQQNNRQSKVERQIEFARLSGRLEGVCQILLKDMYLHYDSVEEICEIAKTYIGSNPEDTEEIETIQKYFLKIESLLKYSLDKKTVSDGDGKLSNSIKSNPYEKMVKKFQ